MPALRDVLPHLDEDESYRNSGAYNLKDVEVLKIKLATGAPCSSHDELFAPWPGGEMNIEKWFILVNGVAVGMKLNDDGVYEFPLFDMEEIDH